ncbi:MAG: hypothetical protein LBB22_02350 [Treponema sp.]|jgi:hypothetical protein|nr:hypothetical protein [Treponema sp.]
MNHSNTAFRSVEQWKAALITLPDTHFFNLMRSILGNIQSPFNKQRLLNELVSFLSNNDIQKTIASYIDQDDHKIIAAIAALNEPCRWDLGVFFNGDYSYAELDTLVLNLEERLIVYTVKEDGKNHLSLNPLLKKILSPAASNNSVLFPCAPKSAHLNQQANFFFDDTFLAAFLTFMLPEKHILKTDGSLRKNLLQKINKIFPEDSGVFAAALRNIGLLFEGSSGYDMQKLRNFAKLTEVERFAYCAAGLYMNSYAVPHAILTHRKFIQHIAAIAVSVFHSLDEDKCYPVSTLKRFIEINRMILGGGSYRAGDFDAVPPEKEPFGAASLIEIMEKTGLLLKTKDGYCKRAIKSRASDDAENIPVIAFNSVFSFILLPEITFIDAVELITFCEVTDAKTSTQFELTPESAVRGFNCGINSGTMFKLLKKFSAARIDAGLESTLNDWEKRHSEIVIIDGISIVLSEGRRYMARTEPLASHIVLNPSPGVYLLDFTEKEEAAAVLKKAGADILSEPSMKIPCAAAKRKASPFFIPVTPNSAALCPPRSSESMRDYGSVDESKEHFRAALDELKPAQMEREELSSRIERKLVISERQLSGAFIRYEKREARGLDYAGKLALVKQAMLFNEALEIVVQDSPGGEKYITGVPLALEKSRDETVLSVKLMPRREDGEGGDNINESGCIKIYMGKIRIIRRIKQSIFSS